MNVYQVTGEELLGEITSMAYGVGALQLDVSASALLRFIDRFLSGDISEKDLAGIAEAFDVNERVVIKGNSRLIAACIFELTSPEVNGDLSPPRMREVKARLSELAK
jgi:hypothetical protein